MNQNDFDDRKSSRREKLTSKKKVDQNFDQSNRDIKKIKELWEEWENEIHRRT